MKQFVLIATCLICCMAVFGCALNTGPTSGTGQAADSIGKVYRSGSHGNSTNVGIDTDGGDMIGCNPII